MRPVIGGIIVAKRRNLKLSNPNDIRKALSRIANMVINGEIDSRDANAITLICNGILGSIRTDEQEKKIRELETILNGLNR